MKKNKQLNSEVNSAVQELMLERFPPLYSIVYSIREQFQDFFAARRPLALVTIGESFTMHMVGKEQAAPWGAPWIAWNHILTNSSREDSFFPADKHLFYGQHGVNIFLAAGGNKADIEVVGTPTYDSAFGRNKAEDIVYTKTILPEWDGVQPLVVVGTENRHRQDVEIESSLAVLLTLPEIHIVLKLHPDEDVQHYTELAQKYDASGKRLTVVARCDLDALLHAAEILVAVYSNIIVNASILGTIPIVYDLSNARVLDFHAAGLALLAESPDALRTSTLRVLGDDAFKTACRKKIKAHLNHFAGPSDGQSAVHAVNFIERHLKSIAI